VQDEVNQEDSEHNTVAASARHWKILLQKFLQVFVRWSFWRSGLVCGNHRKLTN